MQLSKRSRRLIGSSAALLLALGLEVVQVILAPGGALADEPSGGQMAGTSLASSANPSGAGPGAGLPDSMVSGVTAGVSSGASTAVTAAVSPGVSMGASPGISAGAVGRTTSSGQPVVVTGLAGGSGSTPREGYSGRIMSVQLVGRDAQDLECHLGDVLEVTFENPQAVKELKALAASGNRLGLFLDGTFLKGITPLPVPGKPDRLRFELSRTADNETAWGRLLGGRLTEKRPAELAVGLEDGAAVALWQVDDRKLSLVPMRDNLAGILGAIILVFLVLAGWLALNTSLLRDGGIRRSDGRLNTYSLGRTQMFVWFSLVFVAFLFIWAVTGAPPLITSTMLTLMGISGSTGLSSVVIQNSRQKVAQEGLAAAMDARAQALKDIDALKEKLKSARPEEVPALEAQLAEIRTRLTALEDNLSPASEGILRDLLTEGDRSDYTLHRLQIFIWTGVLVVLFLNQIYNTLLMPEFSTNLLALLGISSLTYIGFKFPATS